MRLCTSLGVFLCVIICANNICAQTCGNGKVSSFQFPMDSWNVGCNDFWSSCNGNKHLGEDSVPDGSVVGAPVYAPCSGVVKEAGYHNGYGGTVIMECFTGSECVTPLMGHMFPENYNNGSTQYLGLQVSTGQSVEKGTVVGYLADKNNYRNGGWTPHIHFAIHKGKYKSTFSCDGKWSYAGYTSKDCVKKDWYDPHKFILDHQHYEYKNSVFACLGPVTGGASTNWKYTCENERGVFFANETVQTMIRLEKVKKDHSFSVSAFKNGNYEWSWSSGTNFVGDYPWDYSHFWPTLSSGNPGNWEFEFFVNIFGSDYFLDRLSFTVLPYSYGRDFYTCQGPVTGGASTDWVYSCLGQYVYDVGNTVYALFGIHNVTQDHRFRVYVYKNYEYQWEWTSSWNNVGDGWNHAYFWPAIYNVTSGQWQVYMAVDVGSGFHIVDSTYFEVL